MQQVRCYHKDFSRKLLPEHACFTRLADVKQELKAAADQDQVTIALLQGDTVTAWL